MFLWHQNGVRPCLTCGSSLRRSHDRMESKPQQSSKKQHNSTYFVVRTVKSPRLGWNSARSAYAGSVPIGIQINQVSRWLLTTTGWNPAKPKKRTLWQWYISMVYLLYSQCHYSPLHQNRPLITNLSSLLYWIGCVHCYPVRFNKTK